MGGDLPPVTMVATQVRARQEEKRRSIQLRRHPLFFFGGHRLHLLSRRWSLLRLTFFLIFISARTRKIEASLPDRRT